MTEQNDEVRSSDDAIWQDATTISPEGTKDARIHVTLRLDPRVYRKIVSEKKAMHDRTITATIERLINKGLRDGNDADPKKIRASLETLISRSIAQESILDVIARHVKPALPSSKKKGKTTLSDRSTRRSV